MNSSNIIQFCSGIEKKLDTCLFRAKTKEEQDASRVAPLATGAATGAAVGAGGYLAHQKVVDRMGGLNASRPAGAARATYGAAAADLGKDVLASTRRVATPIAKTAAAGILTGGAAANGALQGVGSIIARKVRGLAGRMARV